MSRPLSTINPKTDNHCATVPKLLIPLHHFKTSSVFYHSAPYSIDHGLLISKHSLSLQSVDYKTLGANLFTTMKKDIDLVDPAPYAQH
jgi:hypothetical protein